MCIGYDESLGFVTVCGIFYFIFNIMQRDVTRCIICISNKFKYFEKEKG